MKFGFISDATKILIFAATIIITCILVALGFQAAETAQEISNSAVTHMSELNNDIKDSGITMYDNSEVYGSDVVNFIKKSLGDISATETAPIYVMVKTSLSENVYTNKELISNIKDFTNTKYIKPTAIFEGSVIRNQNDVIVGVSFIQK